MILAARTGPVAPGCTLSRNFRLRESGQTLQGTVPGDELSVGQERRGNWAAVRTPQNRPDSGITTNICTRLI